MKEFNLEKALAGKPVQLRNGLKALIYYRIPDEYVFSNRTNVSYPLNGICFDKNGYINLLSTKWNDKGISNQLEDDYDIIGMYEDIINDVIERAYKEERYVKLRNGSKAFIWFKVPEQFIYAEEGKINFPYKGAIIKGSSYSMVVEELSWKENGNFMPNKEHDLDIVGLWEE